jgi:hypothetical protein
MRAVREAYDDDFISIGPDGDPLGRIIYEKISWAEREHDTEIEAHGAAIVLLAELSVDLHRAISALICVIP